MSFRLALPFLAVIFAFPSGISAGRYAGDFLDIEVGGRALGMGGAFVALANDGSGALFNPAGLAQVQRREISLMHTWLFTGMASHDFASFAAPVGEGLGLGLSVVRLGVEGIPIFPELRGMPDERRQDPQMRPDGEPEGYFGDEEYAGYVTVAKAIGYELGKDIRYVSIPVLVCVGGNLKYVYQSLMDKTGTGIGIDFGTIVGLKLDNILNRPYLGILSLGISVMDVAGTKITWDHSGSADEIPANFRYGASYLHDVPSLQGEVTLSLQVDTKYGQNISFGAEYMLLKRLAVRAGYTGSDLTLGAGVSGPYHSTLDYAFAKHEIDNTHRICLGVWF
ncbi:MAG: UPF0164 family protein [bacterium]